MSEEKLTKLERETVISYNAEESFAEIYTHEPRLLRKLHSLSYEFPDLVKFQEKNKWDGETYTLPKKLIRIGTPTRPDDPRRKNTNNLSN
jgi:hypothetical protein